MVGPGLMIPLCPQSFNFASFIADEMLDDMMQPKFCDYIRDISSTKYGIDIGKRDACGTDQENVASFRKLNID